MLYNLSERESAWSKCRHNSSEYFKSADLNTSKNSHLLKMLAKYLQKKTSVQNGNPNNI
jgi:hypothetical protein